MFLLFFVIVYFCGSVCFLSFLGFFKKFVLIFLVFSASKDTTKKERVELLKDIVWLTVCLILDALYAGLIIYCKLNF